MNPKIAVVGAGYWGRNLIRNFHALGYLAAICDGNELLEASYRKNYPDTKFITDYENILQDNSIDAIVLATPAVMHYSMARDALLADKHIFVEKPLSLKLSEAEDLVRIADQTSKVLMVGHILQYHNAVLKLKELLDDGELGKIEYIYSNRLNIGKIRTEENILWSFAPHDISVILMLLNEMPKDITTSGGSYLQERVSDTSVTLMRFASGVNAHIFVSWLHPFKEQKLVVVGDRKMAVFNDTIDEKLMLYPHKIKWQNRMPVASRADAEIIPVDMAEPLKAECEHFVSCIRTGNTPTTDGHEGIRVLKILKASQKSLDEGGSVVKLDENGDDVAIMEDRGPEKKYKVHETACIDEGTQIGDGTRIWHFSHVLKGSRIGPNCRIGQNVVIGPNVNVGGGCKIQNNVSIFEGVTMEDHVFCGPSMVFTNVFNPRSEISRMHELRTTLVKHGATLGANCTVICGNTIGSYAFIGAGAVVSRDVPDYALVTGNPGRITGWMCSCGQKLRFNSGKAACIHCNTSYKIISESEIKKE